MCICCGGWLLVGAGTGIWICETVSFFVFFSFQYHTVRSRGLLTLRQEVVMWGTPPVDRLLAGNQTHAPLVGGYVSDVTCVRGAGVWPVAREPLHVWLSWVKKQQLRNSVWGEIKAPTNGGGCLPSMHVETLRSCWGVWYGVEFLVVQNAKCGRVEPICVLIPSVLYALIPHVVHPTNVQFSSILG